MHSRTLTSAHTHILTSRARAHARRERTHACPTPAPPLLGPLLDPDQRERVRERERERERGREREEEGDTEKEREVSERATHTPKKGSKPSAHPSRLCPHPLLCMSLLFSLVSLCPLTRLHTRTHLRTAGWEERGQRRVSSLSQHTQDDGGTSPPHVHAAMLTVRDPALARIPRRYLYLNVNKLDHLPETIFRNLTSLR